MSEQQPLLLPSQDQANDDVERGVGSEREVDKGRVARWRETTGEVLESRTWHYIVIFLARILTRICTIPAKIPQLPNCRVFTMFRYSPTQQGPDAPVWLEVLSYISLGITTLFLIETPLTLWAMGFSHYNPFGPVPHAGLHLFDSTVIFVTFVLEVGLRGRERELAGLLIVLRLWRLVKLVGGVAVGAAEFDEENAALLAETRKERDRALTELKEAQAEIRTLRARLGFTDPTE
ncbi:hypothetical protein BC835DRAFT_1420239 [Cytidiella melzeri]|nr:hypothetical protein BC835DRAFT_1420239 [Cytidiella melzeri]